jgi:hypothetical protein
MGISPYSNAELQLCKKDFVFPVISRPLLQAQELRIKYSHAHDVTIDPFKCNACMKSCLAVLY